MPELVAPEHVMDAPDGRGVIADSTKIVKPEEKADRPAWLPEKFKTPEDMAKAYGELETKLGKNTPAAPTVEDATAKGIDVKALEAEYVKDGKLSADSLKKLTDAGFSEAHVAAYVEGVRAKQSQAVGEFEEIAGGKEQLANVLKWAETNLDASEQAAYNALLDSGNTVAAKIMLKDIMSRFGADVGESENLVEAEPIPGSGGIKPFGSMNEVVAAMNDKRYKEGDPAYHRKVQMRLSISDL